MTASGKAWWKCLSRVCRHKIACIVNNWQACRAERIETSLPLSSPEGSSEDEDQTVEEASDNMPKPEPVSVSDFTMA